MNLILARKGGRVAILRKRKSKEHSGLGEDVSQHFETAHFREFWDVKPVEENDELQGAPTGDSVQSHGTH